MTHPASPNASGALAERQRGLQAYEQRVCVACGEPLKRYLAHYPYQEHIRCLIRAKASALVPCWER